MFPPHTAYRTIYQPQKIFYYFSKVSPTLIFPQISYHPEQGRMKTHTPSADPIRNTHRHSQSADIGYDNLRQVADFPFRTAPDGFFAKRAGRDDHLGTGSFQLPGHGFCDLHLLTVGDRRIGDRRAAAGGVFAGFRGFEQFPDSPDHGTRIVVNPAATSQFAGVVVGITRRAVPDMETACLHQTQDIFRMVQHLDPFERIILTKNLEADRTRGHERRDAVLAEQLRIVAHHLARRIRLTGQFQRASAADAPFAVGPPDLFAGGLEYFFHRRHRTGRQEGHAPGEIAHLPLAGRAV